METKNIYQKILAVQSEIGVLTKDKNNPFFHSTYLDINSIIAALLPLLTRHNLCVIQPLTSIDGKAAIRTVVKDIESIDEVGWSIPLPETAKAQDMGSAITYLRRYSLQSFFLLQADDDDGNAATGKMAKAGVPVKSNLTKALENSRDKGRDSAEHDVGVDGLASDE